MGLFHLNIWEKRHDIIRKTRPLPFGQLILSGWNLDLADLEKKHGFIVRGKHSQTHVHLVESVEHAFKTIEAEYFGRR